jgi:hypothetical protein
MLGVMNLGISAGPKHFKKAYPTEIAECVAGQMKDEVIVSGDGVELVRLSALRAPAKS